MSFEATMLTRLKEALEGSGEFAVKIKASELKSLPKGTVEVLPIYLDREPAGGEKQRWEFNVLIYLAARAGDDAPVEHRFKPLCDQVRVIHNRIDAAVELHSPLNGIEKYVRGRTEYLYPVESGSGAPVGAMIPISFFWVE